MKILIAGSLLLVAMTASTGQDPKVVVLKDRDGVLDADFSVVRGIRELSDGRVIVIDFLEQRVAVGDFKTKAVRNEGRTGAGPREFAAPAALLPFRGDSTLLVDDGNSRIGVLDQNGVIRRFLRITQPAMLGAFGADVEGRVYFSIAPWHAQRPLPGDSLDIAVWDTKTDDVRVIARVHGWTPSKQIPGQGPRIPYVVFAPQDAWTVTGNGRVGIVRDGNSSVDWIDGTRVTHGPAQRVTTARATAADKRAAVVRFAQTAMVGGRGKDGGTSMSIAGQEFMSDKKLSATERASTFAPQLPAFRPGSAMSDPSGRIWVARWESAGKPVTLDVFYGTGARVATVQLEAGKKILSVGREHVYVVRTDEDDLQHVERYRLPL